MPVTDIGQVTTAIIEKINQGLSSSGLTISVFADPVNEERSGLSLYLYHAKENVRFKNIPPPGRDIPPVKLMPLTLDLYYQLTALFHDSSAGMAALEEQKWMTVALKTLHDSPLINVDEDKFRITLQPLPYTEAVHNWTAGSQAMKFSAYYEVSPVFIEPEKATSASGRVLLYGNYVFTMGTPQISTSRSKMTFTLPGEISPRIVESTPAQVSPGDTLIIEGSGFTEGVLQLRIYNSRFEENIVVPNWLPDPKATEITATVDTTARLERNGNIVEVLPGIYTAQVLLTKTFAIPGGGNKEFVQSSNQFPFMVTPVVSSSSLSGDILTIQGAGFQVMTDPIIEKEEMEVYAGMHQFHRSMTTLGADPGQFRVISTTEIELRLPVNMETGTQPIRVIVAGAESKPSWANI